MRSEATIKNDISHDKEFYAGRKITDQFENEELKEVNGMEKYVKLC